MSQYDNECLIADRGLAVLGSNWSSFSVNGGGVENGGALISTTSWDGFGIGAGDFAVISEICVGPTATIPTDPAGSTPAGWTSFGTNTFTDASGRGCRTNWGAKILTSSDIGSRVRFCAVPAAGNNAYRQTICRVFYMNRPVLSFTSGGGVGQFTGGDPTLLTVLAGAQDSTTAYDLMMAIAVFHGVKAAPGLTDADTPISPAKGTEFFAFDGMTRAESCGNDDIANNAKIKYNAYCRGDTAANMTLDMIDSGSTNAMAGAYIKLR